MHFYYQLIYQLWNVPEPLQPLQNLTRSSICKPLMRTGFKLFPWQPSGFPVPCDNLPSCFTYKKWNKPMMISSVANCFLNSNSLSCFSHNHFPGLKEQNNCPTWKQRSCSARRETRLKASKHLNPPVPYWVCPIVYRDSFTQTANVILNQLPPRTIPARNTN